MAILCHGHPLPSFAILCHPLPSFAILCHPLPSFAILCRTPMKIRRKKTPGNRTTYIENLKGDKKTNRKKEDGMKENTKRKKRQRKKRQRMKRQRQKRRFASTRKPVCGVTQRAARKWHKRIEVQATGKSKKAACNKTKRLES
jgi:hypothetical protein